MDRYGYDATVSVATFNNRPAPLTHSRQHTAHRARRARGACATRASRREPTAFAIDGLIVTSGNPLLTPLAREGLFVVQDEASQLVGSFVGAAPGEVVFDACASPGGKTTQMAASMGDQGRIVAADIRGRRLELLARAVQDSTARCIEVIRADAREALPFLDGVFDAVLVDAPCSGLGTIRRDPDIRWRRKEAELPALATRQAT